MTFLWIALITWAFLGLAGFVQLAFWAIVDWELQTEISSKIAFSQVKLVTSTSLALVTAVLTPFLVASAVVGGPILLVFMSDRLAEATYERVRLIRQSVTDKAVENV